MKSWESCPCWPDCSSSSTASPTRAPRGRLDLPSAPHGRGGIDQRTAENFSHHRLGELAAKFHSPRDFVRSELPLAVRDEIVDRRVLPVPEYHERLGPFPFVRIGYPRHRHF